MKVLFKTSLIASILLASAETTDGSRLYRGLRGDAEQEGRDLKKKKWGGSGDGGKTKGGSRYKYKNYVPPYTAGPATGIGEGNRAPQNYNDFFTFFPQYAEIPIVYVPPEEYANREDYANRVKDGGGVLYYNRPSGSNQAQNNEEITATTVKGEDGLDYTVYVFPNDPASNKAQSNTDPGPSVVTAGVENKQGVPPPCNIETWLPGVHESQEPYKCNKSNECASGVCAYQSEWVCMNLEQVAKFGLRVKHEDLNECFQAESLQRVGQDDNGQDGIGQDGSDQDCVPPIGTVASTEGRCNNSDECCGEARCYTSENIVGGMCFDARYATHNKLKGWVEVGN